MADEEQAPSLAPPAEGGKKEGRALASISYLFVFLGFLGIAAAIALRFIAKKPFAKAHAGQAAVLIAIGNAVILLLMTKGTNGESAFGMISFTYLAYAVPIIFIMFSVMALRGGSFRIVRVPKIPKMGKGGEKKEKKSKDEPKGETKEEGGGDGEEAKEENKEEPPKEEAKPAEAAPAEAKPAEPAKS